LSISAPGKMMLLGDYAVLEGSVAVVAAVNRRARGHVLAKASGPASPVVQAVLDRAFAAGHVVPPAVEIDTSTFKDATGTKLGVGSSSAVAVITAALATGKGDEETLQIAIEGHRDAAGGRGSGVDVAACFSGGVIVTKRQPGPIEPLSTRIRGLELSVLYTGSAASTPELVKRCQASPRWSHWMGLLKTLTDEGIEAWRAQKAASFVSVVQRYGRAMADMGHDAGVPVVTEQIDQVMRLASARGAAAKPSGAGGGDVVVMWGPDRAVAEGVAAETGCSVVDLQVDPVGLNRKT